jgi:hypothetical protein
MQTLCCRLGFPVNATREIWERVLSDMNITSLAAAPPGWSEQERQALAVLLNRRNRSYAA